MVYPATGQTVSFCQQKSLWSVRGKTWGGGLFLKNICHRIKFARCGGSTLEGCAGLNHNPARGLSGDRLWRGGEINCLDLSGREACQGTGL